MIKIVILDGFTTNPGDLNWNKIAELGDLTVWDRSEPNEIVSRAKAADIIITNKCIIGEDILQNLPILKCICTLATGYNNIDIDACRSRGIAVCNAVGYSSYAVAQHVFALILHHFNAVHVYIDESRNKTWSNSRDWTYQSRNSGELLGKSIGIYGLGRIGKTVAEIAKAFGMVVFAVSRGEEKDTHIDVNYVNENDLFIHSDIVTLHAPLSDTNRHFVNDAKFNIMKPNAVLVNTGRGGLINEKDLYVALANKRIQAAYLDVLDKEPPDEDHPLLSLDNCYITPHRAWAAVESRQRLIQIVASNIKGFIENSPRNRVI